MIDAEITPQGLRLDGTTYPLELVRAALRGQSDHARLQDAAALAVAVGDVQRAARGRLAACASPVAARLLAQLDDAEAQAWARLGELLGDDGPRVPRREA